MALLNSFITLSSANNLKLWEILFQQRKSTLVNFISNLYYSIWKKILKKSETSLKAWPTALKTLSHFWYRLTNVWLLSSRGVGQLQVRNIHQLHLQGTLWAEQKQQRSAFLHLLRHESERGERLPELQDDPESGSAALRQLRPRRVLGPAHQQARWGGHEGVVWCFPYPNLCIIYSSCFYSTHFLFWTFSTSLKVGQRSTEKLAFNSVSISK